MKGRCSQTGVHWGEHAKLVLPSTVALVNRTKGVLGPPTSQAVKTFISSEQKTLAVFLISNLQKFFLQIGWRFFAEMIVGVESEGAAARSAFYKPEL